MLVTSKNHHIHRTALKTDNTSSWKTFFNFLRNPEIMGFKICPFDLQKCTEAPSRRNIRTKTMKSAHRDYAVPFL